MTYDIPGRGMFHSDCKVRPSGIMKDLHKSKPDEDGTTLHAYECLNCHEIGHYGIQEKTRIIIVKGGMIKTADERSQEFIDGFKGEDGVYGNPFSEDLELNLVSGIARIIKEVSRDTRHACAESVAKVKVNYTGDAVVDLRSKANSAIMNVKAV